MAFFPGNGKHLARVLTCSQIVSGITLDVPQYDAVFDETYHQQIILPGRALQPAIFLQDGSVCEEAVVLGSDRHRDLAVVRFIPERTLSVAPLSSRRVKSREPVGCYGYPWGLNVGDTPHVKSGSCSRLGAGEFDQDIAVVEGMSGTPLFSLETDHVVGAEVSTLTEQTEFGTAVDIREAITGVLATAGVKPLVPVP